MASVAPVSNQPVPESIPLRRVTDEVGRRLVGQTRMVERLLIGLLTGGHILLEGVPGLAKTLAVRTLAEILHATFSRIQFTPDLLPADVVGTMIFDQKTQEFHPKKGPLFAHIVLADEINRASPKTQSALLESMEERQVTVDTVTYQLGSPFQVIATQNPIEHEGTYPLPEAQLDRFMMRIALGYPAAEEEVGILASHGTTNLLETIGAVTDAPGVAELSEMAKEIHVAPALRRYIVSLSEATRAHPDMYLGASPRASIMLLRASRAWAASEARDYVIPDDVKALATPVLAHRLIVTADAAMSGRGAEQVLAELLAEVPIPVRGEAS
jgi:MoxR-like ATPase